MQCTQVNDGSGSLDRHAVEVAVNFTTPSAAEETALAHFIARVTDSDAFITFDPVIHAENPCFAIGTTCAALVSWEHSVFKVSSITLLDLRSLTMTLDPASVHDTHAMLDVTLKWDPNAAREIARRRTAGEPIGSDARRRLRERGLADTVTGTGSVSINWNGQIGAAAAASVDSIDIIPSALACKDCFAYVAAAYSVTFQVMIHDIRDTYMQCYCFS